MDASGFTWSRRASSWAVTVRDRQPREVLVIAVPGGARAAAVLADWDEIAPICRDALAEFLVAAQAGLRFARCEMDERRVGIIGFAAAPSLDADLVHALLGVTTGCDLLRARRRRSCGRNLPKST